MREPSWSDVLDRYFEPRVLRTRATGTPFRMRSVDEDLIVTTVGGSNRLIPNAEFHAAWSYIDREAPKSAWKHVSSNSSYLESVYDDLREAGDAPQRPVQREIEMGLLRQEVKDLEETIAFLRDGRPSADRLESLLAGERETTSSLEARVAELEGHVVELVERQPAASIKDLGAARNLAADLRRQLATARTEGAKALAAAESRRRSEIAELSAQAAELERRRQQASRSAAASERVELVIRFDLGAKSFGSTHRLERDAAGLLSRAAAQFDKDPNYTVTVCRQVLESAARRIWEIRRATPTPRSFSEVMDGLRGDAAVPVADWHLMKQLWSRSSAVVHDRGADREIALWVWLGTREVAELVLSASSLVPPDEPRSTGARDGV